MNLPISLSEITPEMCWAHRHDDWKWSEDAKCYIRGWSVLSPPTDICLGERYAHAAYGLDSYGVRWQGSTADHWHGWAFDHMGEALAWVSSAERSDLGFILWSAFGKQRRTVDIAKYSHRTTEVEKG